MCFRAIDEIVEAIPEALVLCFMGENIEDLHLSH